MTQHSFRFGVVASQAPSGDAWLATARRAEALGYGSLLIPDTLGPTPAPLPALAYAAAGTSTIHLGTYVLANDYRNPVLVAREAATLNHLSGGRFELGLGAGRPNAESDYRKLGIPFPSPGERIARLGESIAVIKRMLGGEEVTVEGRYYAVESADIPPAYRQIPRPPLLIAGGGRRLLSLAAREADIVGIGARPNDDGAAFAEKVGWLRRAAPERFEQLEININLLVAGEQVQQQALAHFGIDPAQLARSGSPLVLLGTPDEMCDQLQRNRETFGISYVNVGENLMEGFAPVVARLAGR